ncbi:TetR/AcrR family transcriptional regulator, partial [Faecalispora jeddahensis]
MPGKENSQERRQWILDAALEVFYEFGFDGARVDEIAKRAGVNQALIYYYFKSKEELYLELINQNVDEMIQEKKNSVGAANTEELYNIDIYNADVIKRLVDHVMRIAKEKEKIFSIILGELF